MKNLKINSVWLFDVGPYENVKIQFRDGMNILCGGNGIGKTTILEAIASPFGAIGAHTKLKRRALASKTGRVVLNVNSDGQDRETDGAVAELDPMAQETMMGFQALARYLINIRTNRSFSYVRRTSIEADPSLDDYQVSVRTVTGLQVDEIKQWFVNRYLMRPHAEAGGWTEAMKQNLELAVSWFSLLDERIKLAVVNVKTYEIEVDTPSGRIPFEYLSAGFRSVYSLFLGILKEIEYRSLDTTANEFSGVILIDELDLHLHPAWQSRVARALQTAFPNAQIIASTHSPHIIQAAEVSEVIALARDPQGDVYVRNLPPNEYGFAGWSIDEILEDVMDMPSVKSPIYEETERLFDNAIEDDDADGTRLQLARLQAMLHPSSYLKTLFELRAAPVLGAIND